MIHLHALPGAPGFAGSVASVESAALRDLDALVSGGADGVMMENFCDVPFFKGRVPAETVASMTRIAAKVCENTTLPIGINVLRNDALSAIAIASAVGAAYVRINVLSGSAITDQGIIEGQAAEVLRYRQALGASHIKLMADVRVKHAAPLAERLLEDEVEELVLRAGADAVIASGAGTGKPTDMDHLARVKQAAGNAPVFVGSGVSVSTAKALSQHADGLIVGTAIKEGGRVDAPVDADRVRKIMQALA